LKTFKYALVWGSGKHMPQRCGLAHVLEDEDVVQIVKAKCEARLTCQGLMLSNGTMSAPGRVACSEVLTSKGELAQCTANYL
jgi:uncharacterized protein